MHTAHTVVSVRMRPAVSVRIRPVFSVQAQPVFSVRARPVSPKLVTRRLLPTKTTNNQGYYMRYDPNPNEQANSSVHRNSNSSMIR